MDFKNELHNYLQNLNALSYFLSLQDEIMEKFSFSGEIGELLDVKPDAVSILEKSAHLYGLDGELVMAELASANEEFNSLGVEFSISDEDNKSVRLNIKNKSVIYDIQKAMQLGDLSNRQMQMLNRSSLTSLMIYFESLIASIIKARLVKFPNAFNPNDKSIKYKDLMDFDSMDEALEHLIEIEVVDIMYNGFKVWIQYLSKSGIKIDMIEDLIEEINEISQRRNLFVHNDGVVNKIYLNKVDSKFIKEVKKNDRLSISKEYLKNAIKIIKIFGTIILLEAWRNFEKEDFDQNISYLSNLGFEGLRDEEWEFSKYIYEGIYKYSDYHAVKTSMQINIWLCQKQLGYFESIKDNISKFDVSGMQTYFKLCIHALLEENDDFFSLLEKEPNAISKDDLITWPIFKLIREDSRFSNFVN
ncbi:hypothetical protein [Ureibacillus sinduriensis]|uniref:Uncharacterized protein n=1 Tax=Ureibacillus sinduriensis BLB-1 = JCM 15800 TaxID=1384057 RepID=A0A0A3IJ43_9BACL|nr:hypothetical protein [Ureibacillus sinduriensis]KGR74882.1 hypothetical protein CD33_14075 [Ureibacillus sinduriensis BLB-1 = JCM 15800]